MHKHTRRTSIESKSGCSITTGWSSLSVVKRSFKSTPMMITLCSMKITNCFHICTQYTKLWSLHKHISHSCYLSMSSYLRRALQQQLIIWTASGQRLPSYLALMEKAHSHFGTLGWLSLHTEMCPCTLPVPSGWHHRAPRDVFRYSPPGQMWQLLC